MEKEILRSALELLRAGAALRAREVEAMPRQTTVGTAPVSLVCELVGISRTAYYAARRRRERPPRDEPEPPRLSRWPATPDVIRAVRAVAAEHPAWGVRKVWAAVRRDHGLRVAQKRIWALMRAEGLTRERSAEPAPSLRGHVTTTEPNVRLATDLTTVSTTRDGVVAIVPTVDCGCRSLLGLAVSTAQDAETVLTSVDQAMERAFGRPAAVPAGVELLTDRGSQYTGSACAALCERWRLKHILAAKGRPTGNAVAERLIRTMKEEVLWPRDWSTAAEVREALAAWRPTYNDRRPHQALGYLTPTEYRRAHLGVSTSAIPPEAGGECVNP